MKFWNPYNLNIHDLEVFFNLNYLGIIHITSKVPLYEQNWRKSKENQYVLNTRYYIFYLVCKKTGIVFALKPYLSSLLDIADAFFDKHVFFSFWPTEWYYKNPDLKKSTMPDRTDTLLVIGLLYMVYFHFCNHCDFVASRVTLL